ncbi:MAG: hypothetical protein LBK45_01375 [Tannerellaceae bacterium]|jgi:hypothetical protein|nr:hypothetical protein [Tannerellaceae bacterium]
MKKLISGSLLAGILMLFNSCLGGENSSSSQDQRYGVVEMNLKAGGNVIYYNDQDYPFYSPTLSSKILDGECCWIAYMIKSEDNQNVATLGYYTIQEENYVVVDKGMVRPAKTDTAVVKENELPMSELVPTNYVKGYLFVNSMHEAMGTTQKNEYELSYDMEQEPLLENTLNNGTQNVYQLYLRATKLEDGKSPTLTQIVPNTYNVKRFFDSISYTEKGKGKTEYYFKINYIRSFADDSVANWTSTEALAIIIPTSE